MANNAIVPAMALFLGRSEFRLGYDRRRRRRHHHRSRRLLTTVLLESTEVRVSSLPRARPADLRAPNPTG